MAQSSRASGGFRGIVDHKDVSRPEDRAMTRFSAFAVVKNALTGHAGWREQWPDAQPKKEYDVIIVGAGISGALSAAEAIACSALRPAPTDLCSVHVLCAGLSPLAIAATAAPRSRSTRHAPRQQREGFFRERWRAAGVPCCSRGA